MTSRPWADPVLALKPAQREDFMTELTACLSLCGAVGMSEDTRVEWLKVARATLNGIPVDLLKRGCAAARKVADHPSKIVPAIMAEVEGSWNSRKRAYAPVAKPEPLGTDRQIDNTSEPIPVHEIRAMSEQLRRMALNAGWITQADIDEADRTA